MPALPVLATTTPPAGPELQLSPPVMSTVPPVLPEPALINIVPACESRAVLSASPALIRTLPPAPLLPMPTPTCTQPLLSAAHAAPDKSFTDPLLPSVAQPLHSDTGELAPDDEPTHTDPLASAADPSMPQPLLTTTSPPLDDVLDPAHTCTSPLLPPAIATLPPALMPAPVASPPEMSMVPPTSVCAPLP